MSKRLITLILAAGMLLSVASGAYAAGSYQVKQVADYGTVVKAVSDKELTYNSKKTGKKITVKPAPASWKFQYASFLSRHLLPIPAGEQVYVVTDGEGLLYGLYTPLLPPENLR